MSGGGGFAGAGAGTGARQALQAALRDLYEQSWRLLALNAALAAGLLLVAAAVAVSPVALVLVALLGPLLASLVHCEVVLVRTEELRLADALDGLRLHWRRGLALGAAGAAATALGVLAIASYARGGSATIPLAFLVGYVLALLWVVQLFAWPLAVAEPDRPLREVAREAAGTVLRRPLAALGLGAVLLLVNLAGIVAAVMPFLTLTIAYTFLAAARFVLPREEVTA